MSLVIPSRVVVMCGHNFVCNGIFSGNVSMSTTLLLAIIAYYVTPHENQVSNKSQCAESRQFFLISRTNMEAKFLRESNPNPTSNRYTS